MARPRGLFKRGACWYARLWQGGKDRRIAVGQDYGKALDQLDKLQRGEEPVAHATTVDEVADLWIQTGLPGRRKERGVKEVAFRWRTLTSRFLGHMALDRVRVGHMRELRRWLSLQRSRKTGNVYSQQTVRHALVEASMMFKWAVESGLIEKSPVPDRLLPGVPKGRPRPYSCDEVKQLLQVPEPYLWVIRLGLATACRWGELCSLQAKDLEGQWLTVHQFKTDEPKRVLIEPGLSREIFQRVGRLVPFSPTSKGSFNGKVSRLVGFKFNTRRLRHTAATQWLSGGIGLEFVSKNLGHQSVTQTETYAGLLDEARRREMEAYWERTGTKTGAMDQVEAPSEPAKMRG